MEVKNNDQRTDYGVIPSDWQCAKIQVLIENKIIISHLDGNHGALYPRSHEFKETGVPYIAANDFITGIVNFESCKYVSKERALKFQKGIAKDGDVLFAHNATVGPVALLKTFYDYVILSTTATYYRCDNKRLFNKYLQYALCSDFFVKQYKAVMAQSTRFQVPITAQRKFYLAIPSSFAEQTAIATALSDADALISSLEKFIAKKRNIKLGAMQQLLQPKKHWTNKKIGEVGLLTGAGVDKKINTNETPVRLLNYMDVFKRDFIYSNELNHWVTARSSKIVQCSILKGDIFFTPSSEMRYDIAISAIAKEDISEAVYSYHLYRLRLMEDWDINFRSYIFKTNRFLQQAETLCEGSGKRYVIALSKFREMTISYPADKKEQQEISTTLYNLDLEVSALEAKLEKYKRIKQGMMQQLLTGKIRLV